MVSMLSMLSINGEAAKAPCVCSERDRLHHSEDAADSLPTLEEFPLLNQTNRLLAAEDYADRSIGGAARIFEAIERRQVQYILVCDYGSAEETYKFWYQSPPGEIDELMRLVAGVTSVGYGSSGLLDCPTTNFEALDVRLKLIGKWLLPLFDDWIAGGGKIVGPDTNRN